MVILLYEKKPTSEPQDLNELGQLLQDLNTFVQLAGQDKFKDYNNESLCQICTSALIW